MQSRGTHSILLGLAALVVGVVLFGVTRSHDQAGVSKPAYDEHRPNPEAKSTPSRRQRPKRDGISSQSSAVRSTRVAALAVDKQRLPPDTFTPLRKLKRGASITLDLADFTASGVVDSVLLEPGISHFGISLAGDIGRLTVSLRDDALVLGHLSLYGQDTVLRITNSAAKPDLMVEKVPYWKTACAKVGTVCPHPKMAFAPSFDKPAIPSPPAPGPPFTPVPALSSLAGASYVIYLDFDGQEVTHPLWNHGNTIDALPHPNHTNTAWVTNVWKRVAEDYAPFAINVTTTRAVYDAAPAGRRMMCVVTPTNIASPGTGGAAFPESFPFGVPCWCFNADEYSCADTISHEVGHTLGLQHDGRAISPTDTDDYYGGHGTGLASWAPIMGGAWSDAPGTVYLENVTQWSKGEYALANNPEDDLAGIAAARNGFGWRIDDKGNTREGAAPLKVVGTSIQDGGLIEREGDVDWMRFDAGPGVLSVRVDTLDVTSAYSPTKGANLAVRLRLYDAAGAFLQEANDATGLSASLSRVVQSGVFHISVEGAARGTANTGFSKYASLGQYTLSGNTVEGTPPPPEPDASPPVVEIASPATGATSLASMTVEGTATDNVGVVAVEIRLNGGTWQPALGTNSWTAPVTFVTGENTIDVRAKDATGHNSDTATRIVTYGTNVPRLVVEQPAGKPLSNGSGSVSFGPWAVGSAKTKSFVIRNAGTGNLTSLALTLTGANAGDFSISGLGATTVAPRGSIPFTVSMAAGAAGARNATLVITTNDVARSPFRVSLSGTGLPPVEGSYYWSILAGKPGGDGNADGTGSMARFSLPHAVVADAAGNLFIADKYNHTIRKMTPAGVVTTFAGRADQVGIADGVGGVARFNNPAGLAIDNRGNIYVADTGSHTIRKITPAGVVTTIAGEPGQPGFSNGVGNAAKFQYPTGLVVDALGNLYASDQMNHLIRMITPTGEVSTRVGSPGQSGSQNGTGGTARLLYPMGLAIDGAGNLLVADMGNHTIRQVTPGGDVTTLAGLAGQAGDANGLGSAARFNGPVGVACRGGDIFVADMNSRTVRKISTAGVVTTPAGSPGLSGNVDGAGSAARFIGLTGITMDGAGNVWIASYTIRRLDQLGEVTTIAGSVSEPGSTNGSGSAARFSHPTGLAVNGTGDILIADSNNSTVRTVTRLGEVTVHAGDGQPGYFDGNADTARFYDPAAAAIDSAGNLFIAERGNHTIRKIGLGGMVSTIAGTPGQPGFEDGPLGTSQLSAPTGIAAGPGGSLFVSDSGNHTIRAISSDATMTTLVGSATESGSNDGIGDFARFSNPKGIAVDGDGVIFIADSGNHTIRRILPSRRVDTIAGTPGEAGWADGSGGLARFNHPSGIAIDANRNLYVADTGNHIIRKITSAGQVTTIGGAARRSGARNGMGSAAVFGDVTCIAIAASGSIMVSDASNNCIYVGTPVAPGSLMSPLAAWRLEHFGISDDLGEAADSADPDHDGYSNFLEYALNGNPMRSNTECRPRLTRSGAYFRMNYTRRTDALQQGLSFLVEWSTDLSADSWTAIGASEKILSDDGTTQDIEVTAPATGTRIFFRLRVSDES